MLEINTEYRHGILFVRLSGVLNNNTVDLLEDTITDIIEKGGITYLLLNLEELSELDKVGINSLFNSYSLVNKNKGFSMICGACKDIQSILNQNKLFKFFYEVSDELSAMKVIEWNN